MIKKTIVGMDSKGSVSCLQIRGREGSGETDFSRGPRRCGGLCMYDFFIVCFYEAVRRYGG